MKNYLYTLFVLTAGCGATTDVAFVSPVPLDPQVTTLTPLANVPRTGPAIYQGAIGVGFGETLTIDQARVVGDMRLEADFERNRVSGVSGNFLDQLTGDRLAGQVGTVLDIDRDANLTAADGLIGRTRGTLYDKFGDPVSVDLDTYGDFYGRRGQRIVGEVEGQVTGLLLTPQDNVTGVFDVRN